MSDSVFRERFHIPLKRSRRAVLFWLILHVGLLLPVCLPALSTTARLTIMAIVLCSAAYHYLRLRAVQRVAHIQFMPGALRFVYAQEESESRLVSVDQPVFLSSWLVAFRYRYASHGWRYFWLFPDAMSEDAYRHAYVYFKTGLYRTNHS